MTERRKPRTGPKRQALATWRLKCHPRSMAAELHVGPSVEEFGPGMRFWRPTDPAQPPTITVHCRKCRSYASLSRGDVGKVWNGIVDRTRAGQPPPRWSKPLMLEPEGVVPGWLVLVDGSPAAAFTTKPRAERWNAAFGGVLVPVHLDPPLRDDLPPLVEGPP